MRVTNIEVGTAGWSIPRQYAAHFPSDGTSLERYSSRFRAAEINSSFHRPHRAATWDRWHDSVPDDFRFSVKLPKAITHECRLVEAGQQLATFLDQVERLQDKLAVLLVQLPPKLAFDANTATDFLAALASGSPAKIACEPRHPSWFEPLADETLARLSVARVATDPAICPEAAIPGGWRGLAYWRLHGSPIMYRSGYGERVVAYADALKNAADRGIDAWCIFDNTASSAAMGDALELMNRLSSSA